MARSSAHRTTSPQTIPSSPALPTWTWPTAPAAVGLLALVLAFANLWRDWYVDPYFAATVQSMRTGWHAFFYVAFDPAGFVSVDKPPLALWLQTACTEALGFHGLALLLPATLAGLGSIAVLYHLVNRSHGRVAGLLAALFLTLTPVAVANNRSNNMDSLTAFLALLAAWGILRAAESGRLRPLLLAAVALALGCNAKLLQAFVVVPAFALLYLVVPSVPLGARAWRLLLATAVGLALSFAWVAAVDRTPAGQRPYVGSSSNNTELDLVFGYNGLGRIFGGSAVANAVTSSIGSDPGSPGPLRLLDEQCGGQIGWLLPLALVGLAGTAWRPARAAAPRDRRGRSLPARDRASPLLEQSRQVLLLWDGWLLSLLALYSISSYFHPYNLVMLAPPVCALAAIGAVALWRAYQTGEARWWLLPAAIGLTGLAQAAILLESPDWNRWLVPFVLAVSLGAAGRLALLQGRRRRQLNQELAAAVIGITILLPAPALWASVPAWHYGNVEFPIAGPDLLNPAVESPVATRDFLAPATLTRYLVAHQHGERYMLAARYGSIAAPVMLATGRAVLTYGGYLGEDHILSVEQVAGMVRHGTVRFFWMLNPQAERVHDANIEGWVARHCTLVPPARWQPAGQYGTSGPRLFDCRRQA